MTSTARRHPNVVHPSEVKPVELSKGDRYAMSDRVLGRATGARGIGCSLYEVPPGKTAFPNHYHCANEESLYVLEGTGTLHIGADQVAVGPGDYATFPVGPAHTHQLLNTGTAPLRYLCFSTLIPTEVVGYPRSKKIGAMSRDSAGEHIVRLVVREESAVDYYDGELD